MKTFRKILVVGFAAWLLTGLARLRPEERAVVRRFGEVVAHPKPGLWIGLPWGVDRLVRVTVSVKQLTVGFERSDEMSIATPPGQFLTGDQNLVNIRVVLDYVIDESDAALDQHLLNREKVETVLAREAESLTAEWTASRGVDDVLLSGRAELPRWLSAKLPQRITVLGIVLQRASIDHLAAPAEVREAFEAVNQAQSAIRTRMTLAQREADQRLQQAKTLQYQWEQQAESYRIEKLAAAKADTEAFTKRLEQYRKAKLSNPDAMAAIWWDEMGRTLRGLRGRGRLDVLDAYLGKDGLDLTQFLSPKKP